jgi:hypothetical protein
MIGRRGVVERSSGSSFCFWGELVSFGEGGRICARVREAPRKRREEVGAGLGLVWLRLVKV